MQCKHRFSPSKSDLLWVKILKAKYFKLVNEDLVLTHTSSQSALWKGICEVWPMMMQSVRMAIRDGKETLFWTTRWIDSGMLLSNFADHTNPKTNSMDMVADFVELEGVWDLDKLNRLIPNEIVQEVLGMSVPRQSRGDDEWVWGGESDGHFSFQSTDKRLSPDSMAYSMKDVSWVPRLEGGVTLNTDGSLLRLPDRAAAGGIIRNVDG
ncbi:hypothetical protein LINPERHAP2_LOCUS25194 [Linum perenne]